MQELCFMSNEDSEAIRNTRTDWMSTHRNMYLDSGGAQGHIMDLRAVGGYTLGTHCLIKYTGRKSGKTFITPLCYGVHAGEVAIIASKGGADHHPAWYLNIIERPDIDFQVATQAWQGTWREPEGTERKTIWEHMVALFPFFEQYQASTARSIPVVLLKPEASIPVFRAQDADGIRGILTE